jgi:hypothetical protein
MTEPCKLKEHVGNLPNRATWQQDGKVNEGCVGVPPQSGEALFWFDDLTVVRVPLQMFHKVTEI